MTQPQGWTQRLAAVVAGEVRRHRERLGLSAQKLSDACAELGMPIPRTVLANMESGRRESIGLAEVLVLAQALGVPPLVLIFPVGHVDQVEPAPGDTEETWAAAKWFTGEAMPDTTDAEELRRWLDGAAPLRMHRRRERYRADVEAAWRAYTDLAALAERDQSDELKRIAHQQAALSLRLSDLLREHEQQMHEHGFIVETKEADG